MNNGCGVLGVLIRGPIKPMPDMCTGTTPFVHLCVWWNAISSANDAGLHRCQSSPQVFDTSDITGSHRYHLVMTNRHGFSMAQIEIDGLPMKIAWWIFPWRTFFRHNQMVIPRLPMWSLFWMAWSLARLLPCHRRQVLPAALSSLCRFSWPISRSPLEIEEPKMDLPSGKLT